jgi:hypothetical protein
LFIFKVTEPSSVPYRTLRISIGMPNFEMPNLDSVLLVQWLTASRLGISLLVQWLTESRFRNSAFEIRSLMSAAVQTKVHEIQTARWPFPLLLRRPSRSKLNMPRGAATCLQLQLELLGATDTQTTGLQTTRMPSIGSRMTGTCVTECMPASHGHMHDNPQAHSGHI